MLSLLSAMFGIAVFVCIAVALGIGLRLAAAMLFPDPYLEEDLGEDPLGIAEQLRPPPRYTRAGLVIFAAACVLSVLLMLFSAWASAAEPEPFKLPEPSCAPFVPQLPLLPTLGKTIATEFDTRGQADAIVWWCDDENNIEANWRTGNLGAPCEQCFRVDIFSPLSLAKALELDRAAFRRPPTEAEAATVTALERLYEPRCVFSGTAKTTQVLSKTMDGLIGPARTDEAGVIIRWPTAPARPSCWQWIKAGTKRWCSVTGQRDTKGRELGPDSYVACKLTTAPAEGWAP